MKDFIRRPATQHYSRSPSPSRLKIRPRGLSLPLSQRSRRPLALCCLLVLVGFTVHFASRPSLLGARNTQNIALKTVPTRTPTRFRGNVPIVDREKLAEVEARMQYQVMMEDDGSGYSNYEEWAVPPNPDSPPKITAIPEPPRKSKQDALELWPNSKADEDICPGQTPCRLLLPIW